MRALRLIAIGGLLSGCSGFIGGGDDSDNQHATFYRDMIAVNVGAQGPCPEVWVTHPYLSGRPNDPSYSGSGEVWVCGGAFAPNCGGANLSTGIFIYADGREFHQYWQDWTTFWNEACVPLSRGETAVQSGEVSGTITWRDYAFLLWGGGEIDLGQNVHDQAGEWIYFPGGLDYNLLLSNSPINPQTSTVNPTGPLSNLPPQEGAEAQVVHLGTKLGCDDIAVVKLHRQEGVNFGNGTTGDGICAGVVGHWCTPGNYKVRLTFDGHPTESTTPTWEVLYGKQGFYNYYCAGANLWSASWPLAVSVTRDGTTVTHEEPAVSRDLVHNFGPGGFYWYLYLVAGLIPSTAAPCTDLAEAACGARADCRWDHQCESGCYGTDAAGIQGLQNACPDYCTSQPPTGVGECPAPCNWDDCTCGWKCMFPSESCSDIC